MQAKSAGQFGLCGRREPFDCSVDGLHAPS
jgi:hypothetical protein